MWGSSAGIICATLGIVASYMNDKTFIILYRVQVTFAVLSTLSTLGAFAFDTLLLLREDMYWGKKLLGLDENGEQVDENVKYLILLVIWPVELISQLLTCVLSAIHICRLGCCCCGCPNLTPDGVKVAPLEEPQQEEQAELGIINSTSEQMQQTMTVSIPTGGSTDSDLNNSVLNRRNSQISDIKIDQTVTFVIADEQDKKPEPLLEVEPENMSTVEVES